MRRLQEAYDGLDKIVRTPLPLSYSRHTLRRGAMCPHALASPAARPALSVLPTRTCRAPTAPAPPLRHANTHPGPTPPRRFLVVWLTFLPFVAWKELGWATVPVDVILAFFLLGIEEIGVQVEEPMGILALEVSLDCFDFEV